MRTIAIITGILFLSSALFAQQQRQPQKLKTTSRTQAPAAGGTAVLVSQPPHTTEKLVDLSKPVKGANTNIVQPAINYKRQPTALNKGEVIKNKN